MKTKLIVLVVIFSRSLVGQITSEILCNVNYHFGISAPRGILNAFSSNPRWKNGTAQRKFEIGGTAGNHYGTLKKKSKELCMELKQNWKAECEQAARTQEKSRKVGSLRGEDCKQGYLPGAEKGQSYLGGGYWEVKNPTMCTCVLADKSLDENGCQDTRLITIYPLIINPNYRGP